MANPRDKKTLVTLIEQAQIVYLLTRYPKMQVLDDPSDLKRLEDGLAGMRMAAKQLPASLRDSYAAIAWDELAQTPDTRELAWRRAKRLAPTVLRELLPLLEGEPEAAFFLRPEKPAPRTGTTAKRSAEAASGTRATAKGTKAKGRASPNGAPKVPRPR